MKFTSSSLGRHLDLYIKPQNAKPADGIHNVEEIKRVRGNVTRRQARDSLERGPGAGGKKSHENRSSLLATTKSGSTRQISTSASVKEGSQPIVQPMPLDHLTAGTDRRHAIAAGKDQVTMIINKLTWEATGVMNDLPTGNSKGNGPPTPRKRETGTISRRTSPTRMPVQDREQQQSNALDEERNRAIAAEMALKEVLSSVQAANARAHAKPLFDFPFFKSNFPSLCLYCLSPAPSLGSTVTSSEGDIMAGAAWSKDPPVYVHLEYLRRWLAMQIRTWKDRRKFSAQKIGSRSSSPTSQQSSKCTSSNIDFSDPHQHHLSSVYDSYASLPQHTQQEQWQFALANHLAFEQESHAGTESRLTLMEQEVYALRTQHYTGESTHLPLHVLPLTQPTTTELLPESELQAWNYDTILNRWRDRIQRDGQTSTRDAHNAPQSHEPPAPPPAPPPITTLSPNEARSTSDNSTQHYHPTSTNGCLHQYHRLVQERSATHIPSQAYGTPDSSNNGIDPENGDASTDDEDMPDAPYSSGFHSCHLQQQQQAEELEREKDVNAAKKRKKELERQR